MPDKVSPSQFAASVKAKYPEYKEYDDLELTNAMVKKYPEYKEYVDFGTPQKAAAPVAPVVQAAAPVSKYQKAVNDDRSEIGKTLSTWYNNSIKSLERLGGAIADLPAQFSIATPGFSPVDIGKNWEDARAFREQPLSKRLDTAKQLKQKIAKTADVARSGYTTREEEQAMIGQFNIMDGGIGLKDIQSLFASSGGMAVDMALGSMTGGGTFVLQGYNDAVEDYDSAVEKAGLEPSAGARGLYGIAGGVINGLLEKFAVDKIVGDTPVFKEIQKKAIANVLRNTANMTGKKAVDAIETAAVAEIKKLTSDLRSKGVRIAYRTAVEGGTEAGQAALEDGAKLAANLVQGNEAFNEEEIRKGFFSNMLNAGVAGGIMGPVFGAASDKAFGRNVNTQVLKDIAEANTPEQLAAINDELAATFDENKFTQEERDAVMANANRYAQIKQTLPAGTNAIAQTIAIPLIENRIKLDNEIQNRRNSIETIDEAFRADEESAISLLEDKRAQINDDIREVVNNEKFDYYEENGKFYKKLGENAPEEISKNRFDLQQLKTEGYATTTGQGTVQQGGTAGNIGQRQGTQEGGAQKTSTQADSRYRNISSEKAVGIPSFLGMTVKYKLPTRTITGTLVQEGQTLSVEDENGDVVAELGNIDELSNMSPEEMNLSVIEPNVELTENGFSVDGKELFNENENPFDAVSVDQNGNVMNVVLTTAGGKRRKFRGRVAQKIADQIDVRENQRITTADENLQKEFALPKPVAPKVITTKPTIAKVTEDNLNDIDNIPGSKLQKKVLGNVKNVVKAIGAAVKNITGSAVSVNIHDQKSFTDAVIEAGGTEQDSTSRGFYMADDGSIHLNMDAIASDTMLHEGFHPILDILAKYNPKIINELFTELESIPEAAGIIAQAKESYTGDVTQKKEAITDFVAGVADGRIVLNPSNFQKIKNFILNMLNKIGIGQGGSDLMKVDNEQGLVKLAKFITEKFTTGDQITLEALDLTVGDKQYDSSDGIDIDEDIPEEGVDRGPQFSKATIEAARKNIKSIASLIGTKISRVVFYDLTRVGPLDIKNIKTGYTPKVEGKGGPFYSYMEQRATDKAVLAFVSINQAIQSLQRQLRYPKGAHAIASQNPKTAHLGNKSTLAALFGDGIGIFQNAATTQEEETEIVNTLVGEIDRISKMPQGEAAKSVKKILKKVDLASIKTINDFRDKILLGVGDSFGSRGSIFAALLQGKQTKVTAATRESHKILHYKYGIPTIADIAEGNNQKELSSAELGDVIKLVRPSTDLVIYTTSKEEFDKYSKKPTPEMKKAGIRIELLPESSAHESYPFMLGGENVALLENYISAAQLYKKFEKLPKSSTFFKVGRMKKDAAAGEIPKTVTKEEGAPKFQSQKAPNVKQSVEIKKTDRDFNGLPVSSVNGTVYHRTNASVSDILENGFVVPSQGRAKYGYGVYFNLEPKQTSFGSNQVAADLSGLNLIDLTSIDELDQVDEFNKAVSGNADGINYNEVTNNIKKAGIDGVISGSEVVVFDSNKLNNIREASTPQFQKERGKEFLRTGPQAIANNVKIGGEDMSFVLDYVSTPKNILSLIQSTKKPNQFFNFNRDVRKPVATQIKNDLDFWKKELASKTPLNKEGDLSTVKRNLIAKYQDRVDALQTALDIWENNAFSLSDISINGVRQDTNEARAQFQKAPIKWEKSKEGKGDPSISSRNPIVAEAAKNLKAGKITNEEYRATVSANSPVTPITRFFEPATEQEIRAALNTDKIEKVNAPITDNTVVGLRLDIPAYKNKNTWVVSVHEGDTDNGPVISYDNVARITDVKFSVKPKGALGIATGVEKTTIGRMFGKWQNIDGATMEQRGDNAKALVQNIVNDPNYVQVGMNPFRHSYFYDRSSDMGRPIVSADEVIQIGGLVYAKNPEYGNWTDEAYRVKGLFDAAGAPVQFQKAPTKSITKGKFGGVKKTYKEQVRYGLLGKESVRLKEKMSGELSAELATAETRVQEAMKTIKKYGGAVTEKDISNFMEGKTSANQLPLDLATQLTEMRAQIDGLTERLIQLGVIDSQESIDYYRENKGKYLLRSYEAINFKENPLIASFTGKGLNIDNVVKKLKNVDNTVVNNALRYLSDRAKAANPSLTDAEAMKIARADANEILSDSEDYVMNKGMTGSTNVKSLRQRKDISPEIRALMGEYTDPLYNYYATIFKVSSLTSSRQYLNSLKEFGMGKFFFTEKTEDATVKFAGDESDALAPLNGIYTFPEIKEALKVADKETTGLISQVAGRVRMFKTVYNPATHVKNIIGNMGFAVSNGHWTNIPEAYKYMRSAITGKTDQDIMNMMDTLNRYGVLNNVIGVGELKAYFDKNESVDDFLKTIYNNANNSTTASKLGKAKANLSKIPKAIEKAYAIEDDVFKILAFVNESNRYSKAKFGVNYNKLSADQKQEIDNIASEIVKDTYPTFSRVPKGVKTLSKVAFIGNFLAFPVESVRTQYNSLSLGVKEIRSGNPKLKAVGYTRLGGALAYNSIFSALSVFAYDLAGAGLTGAIGMLFGDDEEENETSNAIKKNLAPWNKNSEVYVSKFKDGMLEYYDIGSLDSYGYQRRVWNAFWSTKNKGEFDQMMASGMGELLDPWMTKDFVIDNYMKLSSNDNGRGGTIYNPEGKPMDKFTDMSLYVGKQFGPGALGSAIKIADAYQKGESDKIMDEIGAQVFARRYTVDLNKQFQNYIYTEGTDPKKEVGFKYRLENAEKIYRDAKRQKLSPLELSEKYDEALEAYKEVLLTANEYYKAAALGGTNPKLLIESLKKSRIGRAEAIAIITGSFGKYDQAYIRK